MHKEKYFLCHADPQIITSISIFHKVMYIVIKRKILLTFAILYNAYNLENTLFISKILLQTTYERLSQ